MTNLQTLQAKAHEAYRKLEDEILNGNSNLNAAELMDNFLNEIIASTIKEFGAEVERKVRVTYNYPCHCAEQNIECEHDFHQMFIPIHIIRSLTEIV